MICVTNERLSREILGQNPCIPSFLNPRPRVSNFQERKAKQFHVFTEARTKSRTACSNRSQHLSPAHTRRPRLHSRPHATTDPRPALPAAAPRRTPPIAHSCSGLNPTQSCIVIFVSSRVGIAVPSRPHRHRRPAPATRHACTHSHQHYRPLRSACQQVVRPRR